MTDTGSASAAHPLKTILLTGAAGGLGRVLRPFLRGLATTLRVSDLRDVGPAEDGEEVVPGDLADRAAVAKLVHGVDAIVHFGGVSVEARFDAILHANRIAMCFPEPTTRRMLKSYLSYRDLCELVHCGLTAPDVGHVIVYGVSANRETLWRNPGAERIGFVARDSSEPFRAQVEAGDPQPDADDPQNRYHGGRFTRDGPFEEALA